MTMAKVLLWMIRLVLFPACRHTVVNALSIQSNINPPTKQAQRIAIIGGGVGGLAIASRIASECPDADITIYEKNSQVGGRCGSFTVDVPQYGTFRHEVGPSLLLLPQVYRDVFSECKKGASAEDLGLSMAQCIPAYQVVFEDGDRIELGFPRQSDQPMSEAEIQSRRKMSEFETEGDIKWDEYMRACEAFLNCGLPNFIEERFDLPSFPAFLRESLREGAKAWPLKPHSAVLDTTFVSNKMKALASFQDLYVGLEPYENKDKLGGGVLQTTAPAVFGLLAAIELHPENKKAGGKNHSVF
jgi:phytoene dehydrogenase-like protein